MLGWRKHKLESGFPGEISITSDMQMTPPLWQKVRRTKEPLNEGERGEWKYWTKIQHSENEDHGIRPHHFMAHRWGNNGNSETSAFWAPKSLQMTIASHDIKRRLLLRRKVLTHFYWILKSRDIILPSNVHLVKDMVFPVVMYGCESWAIKKARTRELMLLNCGVGEDSWDSLGL